MKIEQFLRNHAFTSVISVPTGIATSPEELYSKCISLTCPDTQLITDAIIGWHELLVRYVSKDGAVLLSRLYESNKDANSDWDNRRNSLTISKNYNYAFCSNHFSRLIFTMALNGFVPSDDDFWDMMVNSRKFYLSSLFGMVPIEKRISAYETKVYNSNCYTPGWYLAHIISVMDSAYKGCSGINIKNIFSLGNEKDWMYDKSLGCIVRHNDTNLNALEKKMAVAHFLRLVDPINYFLVPNKKNVTYKKVNPSDKTPLGENEQVVQYMLCKAYERFGETLIDFLDLALADIDIDQIYSQKHKIGNSKIIANFSVNINNGAKQQTYTYEEKLKIAAYYLRHNEGLVSIEENLLNLKNKKGWVAKAILNELGINTKKDSPHKELLNSNSTSIDHEIICSTGMFKTTLEEIKKRGL